jgi:hypothetical protein
VNERVFLQDACATRGDLRAFSTGESSIDSFLEPACAMRGHLRITLTSSVQELYDASDRTLLFAFLFKYDSTIALMSRTYDCTSICHVSPEIDRYCSGYT